MTTNIPPLDVQQVSISYGDFYAVQNVSFQVGRGEIFGLLGPNGAGKTSLISAMITLISPTEGSIKIFGHNVSTHPQESKQSIGCVPQELVHHGFFTVEEILHIYSGYYGISDNRKQIDFLLDRLALTPHRKKEVNQLSGGIKRRLMIAKALLHKPRLLLLDEPTAGVDVGLREVLWNFVQELRDSGVSILLTTHYLEEAEQLCDRIGILDHGKLRHIGKTSELVEQFSNRKVTISLHNSIGSVNHQQATLVDDKTLVMHLASNQDLGSILSDIGISLPNIRDVQTQEGSLQEAFLAILENKDN